ncbi:glutamate receptor ionotropic, kainate 2-like [Macrosteles quadrilineatus]|uniref:glutamate receptor ionotropic, kainate 2-like n=1 Tax=Macrosteles quadrilineatus TaxID=74068 RepID=UPI0023E33146|nr:glutamate receptor ionotropic, kainate 2-like [Macrosteles quadrilineatus]
MLLILLLVGSSSAYLQSYRPKQPIRLGGLFESSEIEKERVFTYAIDKLNENIWLAKNFTFLSSVRKVEQYDSFKVSKAVCELLAEGVVGVFGPQSVDTTDHVQSTCDTKEIPHVEQRWDIRQRRGSCLVNLYPHPSSIAQALADLVKAFKWNSFTIVFDQSEDLIKMKDLLSYYDHRGFPVTVRQLDEGSNYRPTLRRIKNTEGKNIVLDCATEKLPEVLLQAMQVGLMGSEYSYIITTLDMQSVDLEPFVYGGTNITGFRMIDPEDSMVRDAIEYFKNREISRFGDLSVINFNKTFLKLESALIVDSVLLFARGLNQLSLSKEITTQPLNCVDTTNWEHGYSLINYMKISEFHGVTGLVKFDHEGFRTDFKLDILDLTTEGFRKIGTWNITEGVNFTQVASEYEDPNEFQRQDLRNMSFVVMISLTHPYGMLKETASKLSGNDRYEGMGIDIIQELSLLHGFNYTFRLQPDSSSGNPDPNTGKWNGMIGEVLSGRADLAIADITITRERERDADFTLPFLDLGISILYKKPTKMAPNLFSFLLPFSSQVWYCTIAAYLGVSLLLFVMARISPREWTNPYPCIEEPKMLENQFSLNNSLWFTLGSIMQQGSEIAPVAMSTRMVAGIWWFFTLIMVSSYTANLAAFLTIESTQPKFRTVEDLANQKPVVIKYGAKAGGATANFFRDSNHSTYAKMWQFMQENPTMMVASNEEGVARVMSHDEDYAFLMESTSISYEAQRKCELSQVGGLLDSKGYGIAMRKNSWYRGILSTSIVQLQEKGKLRLLYDKWWKEKRGGGACHDDDGGGEAAELDLDNVGGVFVVLLIGASFACFIALFELIWEIYKKEDKVSFWHELIEEIKFIMSCQGSVKPLKKGNRTEETMSTDDPDTFCNPFNHNETKHPLD